MGGERGWNLRSERMGGEKMRELEERGGREGGLGGARKGWEKREGGIGGSRGAEGSMHAFYNILVVSIGYRSHLCTLHC